jgi:NADPH2:quinone reductase
MRAELRGAIEAGKLRLPLDRSFPLAEAAAALAYMRANAHFGKIVLSA